MVLILDGNSEIGGHVNLCKVFYWIEGKSYFCFLFSFMHAHHVLSYHLISVPWSELEPKILGIISIPGKDPDTDQDSN